MYYAIFSIITVIALAVIISVVVFVIKTLYRIGKNTGESNEILHDLAEKADRGGYTAPEVKR
ncbi:MAG: hypothetical protein ACI4LM_06000 [Anaerovoracaceae bacterium]|jgi:uncharacterized protein YoxC